MLTPRELALFIVAFILFCVVVWLLITIYFSLPRYKG